MQIVFQSNGGFENAEKWLNDISKKNPEVILNKVAQDGVSSLSNSTPKDTGATASGWFTEVTSNNGVSEIAWKNKAHPDTNVNVAKLIDQGHGTGTGGYVSPRPYIKQSMDSVWKNVGDKIAEELVK